MIGFMNRKMNRREEDQKEITQKSESIKILDFSLKFVIIIIIIYFTQ